MCHLRENPVGEANDWKRKSHFQWKRSRPRCYFKVFRLNFQKLNSFEPFIGIGLGCGFGFGWGFGGLCALLTFPDPVIEVGNSESFTHSILIAGANLGICGLGFGGGCGLGLGLGWRLGVGWGSKYVNQNFVFEEANSTGRSLRDTSLVR